jgi:hypothetical protein
MLVGCIEMEVYLKHCHSLKEKRMILKKILNKLKIKFNISVAETGFQDKWQRSLLGFACIGSDFKIVEKTLDSVVYFVEENFDGHIINIERYLY